jgi:drug/metabolite transporter (DMT)-like permease
LPDTNHTSKPAGHKGSVKWAILASFLFALSTPPSKLLSEEETPFLLCGLFYLGSIFGIIPSVLLTLKEQRLSLLPEKDRKRTSPWRSIFLPNNPTQKEVGFAILSVLIGGGAAPILLIWGLKRYPASLGSLLMNAEGIVTVFLAWLIFREPLNLRLSTGAVLGAAGCALASAGSGSHGFSGAIPFFLAAGLWALDSNLLRFLSGWNPVTITLWKGLGSSFLLLPLGLFMNHPPLTMAIIAEALATGGLGYGLSLILFIRSIRSIGVSATGAWFSISPFLGAFLSIVLLKEPVTGTFYGASALLFVAVLFLNGPTPRKNPE